MLTAYSYPLDKNTKHNIKSFLEGKPGIITNIMGKLYAPIYMSRISIMFLNCQYNASNHIQPVKITLIYTNTFVPCFQWQDVLDVLATALSENNITFKSLHAQNKFQVRLMPAYNIVSELDNLSNCPRVVVHEQLTLG